LNLGVSGNRFCNFLACPGSRSFSRVYTNLPRSRYTFTNEVEEQQQEAQGQPPSVEISEGVPPVDAEEEAAAEPEAEEEAAAEPEAEEEAAAEPEAEEEAAAEPEAEGGEHSDHEDV
jgi:hypothetical protein